MTIEYRVLLSLPSGGGAYCHDIAGDLRHSDDEKLSNVDSRRVKSVIYQLQNKGWRITVDRENGKYSLSRKHWGLCKSYSRMSDVIRSVWPSVFGPDGWPGNISLAPDNMREILANLTGDDMARAIRIIGWSKLAK